MYIITRFKTYNLHHNHSLSFRHHNNSRSSHLSPTDVSTGVYDKGTQTNNMCQAKPFLDPSFPKKKKHPISHKIMLLSAVLSLAQKQKISGEVESTLLYYVSPISITLPHSPHSPRSVYSILYYNYLQFVSANSHPSPSLCHPRPHT
jgi:hypothetical protein